MTKKLTSLILAVILCMAALVSCTGGNGAETTGSETTGAAGSSGTAEGTEAPGTTAVEAYRPGPDENADVSSIYSANYAFSNAEIAYAVLSSYQNLLYNAQYYGGPSAFGIDVSKSLKEQTCTFDPDGGTWFDFFLKDAKNNAFEVLALCEAARAAGFVLPDEATKAIDSTLENYKQTAEKENMTIDEYLKKNLGDDITSDVLKNVLEKSYLAQYYMTDIISKVDVSDAVLEAKYNEDKKIADRVDYLVIGLDHSELLSKEDAENEEAIETALNTCRTAASEIVKATTPEDFKTAVVNCLVNTFGDDKEDAENEVETIEYTDEYYYDDPVMNRLFSSAAGDAFVIEDEESGVVYACMLVERKGRDESPATRDVRHILFTKETYKDDTVAKQVYNDWVAGGASIDEFEKLAAEYSEDPGSAKNGGLYEGVTAGEMVEEFNDWLFDSSRVEGDHAIVETQSFGWHIMYYAGGGEPAWKDVVKSAIQSAASEKALEDAKAAHSVTADDALLASIPA